MAFELHRTAFPGIAASAINAQQVVTFDGGDTQRQVLPAATNGVEPLGVALATAVNPGDGVTVHDAFNVVKAVACASVGAGVDVGVATSSGRLGPVTGASGVTRYRVGKTLTAAADGETFSLYVNPKQISNLI
jgi:hypothetical protein